MKNKTPLLITLACLVFNIWLFAGCRSRKVDKDLTKISTSQVSASKLDLKSSSLDLSTFQKTGSEKNYTVIVKETFAPSSDPKQPLSRETTYSNSEKSNTETQRNNLSENKAIKAAEKKRSSSDQVLKNKATEVKGMTTGQSFMIGLALVAVALVLIFFKKIKYWFDFYRYLGT